MQSLARRRFLASLTLPLLASGLGRARNASAAASRRRFTLDLTPGAIGVSGDQVEIIRLAHAHGFESVQPDTGYLGRQDSAGLARVQEALTAAGLKWGSAGLPVEFRRDDETFRRDLARLPDAAAALHKVGVTRIGTWISPASNDRDYGVNMALHSQRLREVAQRLHDHELRLGLEYVGTPSLRARAKFPFIYRLSQVRELIAEINVPGAGVILDSWHWWTAGDTAADLQKLRNEDVVAVDLNDAPAGVALADQQDNHRELPAATGVIPIKDFLSSLLAIDFDGPVRAEPFNAPLNQLDNEAACAKTAEALRRAFSLVS